MAPTIFESESMVGFDIAEVEVDIVVVAALTVLNYLFFAACNAKYHHFRMVVAFVAEVVEEEHRICLDIVQDLSVSVKEERHICLDVV